MVVNKLKYGENQFLNATKSSNEKGLKLIFVHVARLKAYQDANPLDTDIPPMYTRALAAKNIAQTGYNLFHNFEAAQESATLNVDNELGAIMGKAGSAHDWFVRTQAVYGKSNPTRMKAIWNHGLAPFYEGTKDQIINALSTLSLNIGSDTNPLMVVIKAEVDAAFLVLNPDRGAQVAAKGATKIKSGDLKGFVKAAMIIEYRNAGLLMNKFFDNVDYIQESFHDMDLLAGRQQSAWDIHLDPHQNVALATRTQVFNSKFKAKTIGGDGKMYLATTPGGTDSTAVDLTDGLERDFTAILFGITDYGTHRYITVVNQDGTKIEFILKLG